MASENVRKKALVKVCVHRDCCERGSERIYDLLVQAGLSNAEIQKTEDCFRFCKMGPNVAVDGNVLHHMSEKSAVSRVRSEMRFPSVKTDGVGTRAIEELDDVLDNLFA